MKIRFTQFVLVSWFILVSEHPIWSQSTLYFDRGNFMNACQTVPGNQQAIDFQFVPPFDGHPTVTVANVTFTGGTALGKTGINSGIALYNFDSGFPLGIQFANGARAFGGDFSSFLSPYYTSFSATLSLDSGEVLTSRLQPIRTPHFSASFRRYRSGT